MSSKSRWEQVASIGSALSGIAALAGILLSLHLYHLSTAHQMDQEVRARVQLQEQKAEIKAGQGIQDSNEIYRSYLQLSLERPALFGKAANPEAASYVMVTAESLFLDTDDQGWRNTTAFMLSQRKALIEQTRWECSTFNPEFIKFVGQEVGIRLDCVS